MLPASWEELTTEQRLYVYFLLSEGYTCEAIRSYCLLRWGGIKVVAAQGGHKYLVRHDKQYGLLEASQVAAAAMALSFLDELPPTPMLPEEIDGHPSLSTDMVGVPFQTFLMLENLYQGFLHTQDKELVRQMAAVVYDHEGIKLDGTQTIAVFYWFASLKQLLRGRFSHFFQPLATNGGNSPSPRVMSRKRPKSFNWTLGEPLQNSMHKRKNMKNFGGITNKAICWGISAMLGISPMVGIWGVPHAPKSDAGAIREDARTQRKTQAIWGANPKPPISPMACIWENAQAPGCLWGAPHAPNVRRCRYSGCRTQREDASCLGSLPQAPNISDGVYLGVAQAPGCIWGVPHQYLRWRVFGSCPSPRVYMGSAPCPQDRTLPLFGRMPEPQSEGRKLFGEPTPSPQYLRWHVFGRYPSPRVFMGSAPCPQVQTLPLFVEPEPNERTQAIWGAYPKPPISPMACIWELPKPQGVYGERPIPPISDAAAIRGVRTQREDAISPMACIWELPKPQGVYGECPMPPRQDAAAIRGAEPNFSFFNFNSIPHDAKHQLGRHGVLQTTY